MSSTGLVQQAAASSPVRSGSAAVKGKGLSAAASRGYSVVYLANFMIILERLFVSGVEFFSSIT